jgi:hypothetical protein
VILCEGIEMPHGDLCAHSVGGVQPVSWMKP